jgi:scyllo-inositol 2-dehydrogenase (NADP+)
MEEKINAAVIGYGLSGKIFHAPFLHVHKGFELKTILTTGKDAKKHYPGVRTTRSYDDILNDPEIDLVAICSPNIHHYPQAKKALEAGKHIVLEKPVTPTYEEAVQLTGIATLYDRFIFPYQNRRWDGDFLTIKELIDSKRLGRIHNFISHFDRYVPEIGRAAWRYTGEVAGGTLYDLGVHMIDQAMALFGIPRAVFCRLFTQREGSVADDAFDLILIYDELNVTLKAGVLVKDPGPRFIVHGTKGSFMKRGLDTQEGELRAGSVPGDDGFGQESEEYYGLLTLEEKGETIRERIKTLSGNYMAFYDDVYESLVNGRSPEVTMEQAGMNIRVIEAAKESADQMKVVRL